MGIFRTSFFLLCSFITLILLLSGCIQPYNSEFTEATSLIESANNRLSIITDTDEISKMDIGLIKGKATGARNDLAEAKIILDKIPANAFTGRDKADFEAVKVILNIDVELSDMIAGPYVDLIERVQRINKTTSQSYPAEINLIKNDMSSIKETFTHIKNELDSINLENLSPKFKGDIITLMIQFQYAQKSLEDTITEFDRGCFKKCDSGYVLGTDCQCHLSCGSSYCSAGSQCCNGQCYLLCPTGYSKASDCSCTITNQTFSGVSPFSSIPSTPKVTPVPFPSPPPACGSSYCSADSQCCKGQCYTPCPIGYKRASNCACYQTVNYAYFPTSTPYYRAPVTIPSTPKPIPTTQGNFGGMSPSPGVNYSSCIQSGGFMVGSTDGSDPVCYSYKY